VTRTRILFGGSFDPPTLAHRRVVEVARAAFPEAEIVVVPAGAAPHKRRRERTDAEARLAMARLAFAGLAQVRVSDEEVRRPGPSFTVDTLAANRAELGDAADLFWLLGSDSLLDLPHWKEPHRILRLARVLTVARPGFDPAALDHLTGLDAAERGGLRRGVLPGTGPDLSSTEVRDRLARGDDVAASVEPAVLAFIRERGLYGARRP
jgi:nicotinate-nucleotide adenylyltransferase